jgi:F-type H+/Na+-transporting ATPase subunit alpha
MTELTISSEEIRSAISSYVSSLETDTSREEVGTVTDTGDGIAHVEGLPSAMTNELLEFPGGVRGVALNLDVHEIGAVILGDYAHIEEGQQVKRTGDILSVPVGDGFLGRVIDPLGHPIDGLGDIEAETQRVLELQAASVMERQSVSEPLQTGIKAIDSMTPIGRGQRQLIIGDRKTGKTAVASTSRSARRAPRSPVSGSRSRTRARWSTPRSSRLRRRMQRASSGSRPTPVPRWASTGCTRASTS